MPLFQQSIQKKFIDDIDKTKLANAYQKLIGPTVAGDLAFDWYRAFPQIFREKEKYAWHTREEHYNTREDTKEEHYKGGALQGSMLPCQTTTTRTTTTL